MLAHMQEGSLYPSLVLVPCFIVDAATYSSSHFTEEE
jgi:hypothetical protein